METTKQIVYGLGGFIIAVFLMMFIPTLMLTPLSILQKRYPGVADYAGFVFIGIFLVLWWVAYIGLLRWRGKRQRKPPPLVGV
jgi:hypothetical protein